MTITQINNSFMAHRKVCATCSTIAGLCPRGAEILCEIIFAAPEDLPIGRVDELVAQIDRILARHEA